MIWGFEPVTSYIRAVTGSYPTVARRSNTGAPILSMFKVSVKVRHLGQYCITSVIFMVALFSAGHWHESVLDKNFHFNGMAFYSNFLTCTKMSCRLSPTRIRAIGVQNRENTLGMALKYTSAYTPVLCPVMDRRLSGSLNSVQKMYISRKRAKCDTELFTTDCQWNTQVCLIVTYLLVGSVVFLHEIWRLSRRAHYVNVWSAINNSNFRRWYRHLLPFVLKV